jgi:NAD+ kinase
MAYVGILYNNHAADVRPLLHEVTAWLGERGHQVWSQPSAKIDGVPDLMPETRLLMVLGGDGTTLLAARLAAEAEVPIFGVNLGRVGFLSEAEPEAWRQKLADVLDGKCWLERRLMLEADVVRGESRLGRMIALNDVVVSRSAQVRMVRFQLYVDGHHVTTYSADGLIVATPTGSTAYSMAAGGPLLPPQLQNYLVIPVAPHLSFERPVVLHREAQVSIVVEMEHEAIASADGQEMVALASGDEVRICRHLRESLFARVDGPNYFYNRLMQHLSFWSLPS